MQVYVNGVGVFGPGLPDWARARAVLAGIQAYEPMTIAPPAADLLPATERRRTTTSTRVALAVAQQALAGVNVDPRGLPTVFATSSGNPDILHDLCAMLAAGDTQISPTKFHNSVHNAAAGYFSIALGSQTGSTSICAHDATAAAGLLEAVTQVIASNGPLLLVSYDMPYPFPLSERRPLTSAWGASLLLSLTPLHAQAVPFEIALPGAASGGSESKMDDAQLEAARAHNPTARMLPLLQALALGGKRQVCLPFSAGPLQVTLHGVPMRVAA
jgi:hypothetical protein